MERIEPAKQLPSLEIGERVGRLVIQKRLGGSGKKTLFECKCDCGIVFERTNDGIMEARRRGINTGCPDCRRKTQFYKNGRKPIRDVKRLPDGRLVWFTRGGAKTE